MCKDNPKKRKRITRYGKKAREYSEWRDEVAIPHLIAKDGRKCALCGSTGKLDVQHKQKRGSHPELKMSLDNVEFLCRTCHIKVT